MLNCLFLPKKDTFYALSSSFEVWIKREGKQYYMKFNSSVKTSDLEEMGDVGKRNTGTLIKFTPDTQYFDSVKFSVKQPVSYTHLTLPTNREV